MVFLGKSDSSSLFFFQFHLSIFSFYKLDKTDRYRIVEEYHCSLPMNFLCRKIAEPILSATSALLPAASASLDRQLTKTELFLLPLGSWNSLSQHIRCAPSLAVFSEKLVSSCCHFFLSASAVQRQSLAILRHRQHTSVYSVYSTFYTVSQKVPTVSSPITLTYVSRLL